eukprot:10356949-Heterocapsa_arctica.AAC.1
MGLRRVGAIGDEVLIRNAVRAVHRVAIRSAWITLPLALALALAAEVGTCHAAEVSRYAAEVGV